MDKEIISLQNNEWLPSSTYYWPLETALTVFAVSPTNLKSSFNTSQGICIEDIDATQGIIPLFTYPTEANDMEHSNGCVALPFVRTFCKVSLSIRSHAHQDSSLVLKALYMDSIAYKGDFQSLPQPTWTCSEERMRLYFFQGESEILLNAQELGAHMLMGQFIHQGFTAVVDIYDKDANLIEADKTLSTKALNMAWIAEDTPFWIFVRERTTLKWLTMCCIRCVVEVLSSFVILRGMIPRRMDVQVGKGKPLRTSARRQNGTVMRC